MDQNGSRIMEPILNGCGLIKRYGKVTAFDSCDFDLCPRVFLAAIDGKRAAKCSLIKAALGAVIADAGTVTQKGKKVRSPRVSLE
jgi:fructose transport system ATP-binding protein